MKQSFQRAALGTFDPYVPPFAGVVAGPGYAASRSVVTRGWSGHQQFNVSELGGNLAAAGLSNSDHSAADRTITGTLTR